MPTNERLVMLLKGANGWETMWWPTINYLPLKGGLKQMRTELLIFFCVTVILPRGIIKYNILRREYSTINPALYCSNQKLPPAFQIVANQRCLFNMYSVQYMSPYMTYLPNMISLETQRKTSHVENNPSL